MKYYPVNLNLENKKCIVAGGGVVAERKVRRLLECGARVSVVSPEATPRLRALAEKKKIIFKNRSVRPSDINGAQMVISAAGDRKINSLVSSYCRRKGVLVNVVDSPKECDFILPSIIRRGSLTITVSTEGISPALSKRIRRDLESRFGAEYAALLRVMEKLRPEALRKIKNSRSRKAFFQKAVRTEILDLLKKNKRRQAEEKIRDILKNAR